MIPPVEQAVRYRMYLPKRFLHLLSFYSQNCKRPARFFCCIDSFLSDLVENSEDRFSHDMAHIKVIVIIMFMPKLILPYECVVCVEIVLS